MKQTKIIFALLAGFFLLMAGSFVSAAKINIIYPQSEAIQIANPENSQLFYDQLNSKPRDYFVSSDKDFNLYLNLMVPEVENLDGVYSAKIYSENPLGEQQVAFLDGSLATWQEYYQNLDRDYYLRGPELNQYFSAGKYRIQVSSADMLAQADNQGKYVLVIGKNDVYDLATILNLYWQLPLLKIVFTKTSIFEFFLTPFGIAGIGVVGALLILIALIYYLVGVISQNIKRGKIKTLLLTSSGMQMKDEIIKLLQKPVYDISVAFITTAAKPLQDISFMQNDLNIMKEEIKFNVEEVDIEGKTEAQVMNLLAFKDIIFVEGGNTFYLLKAMRACNFEKIIRKLLQEGKVYIGSSAGSIVAGRTIQTAGWDGDQNNVGLKDLKGLNLVPFDIFVHYQPENAEIIKQKMPNPKKRFKDLRILTDGQAILVQGKGTALIGQGEQIIV